MNSKLWPAALIASALLAGHASAQLTKLSGAMTAGGNVATFAVSSNNVTTVFRSNREDASRFDLWRNSVSAGSSVVLVSEPWLGVDSSQRKVCGELENYTTMSLVPSRGVPSSFCPGRVMLQSPRVDEGREAVQE